VANHPLKKQEFILIKRGTQYSYARYDQEADLYKFMSDVQEKEGREIIQRANEQSDFNKYINSVFEYKEPNQKGKKK
jgi:hypothetical protein